MPRIPTYNSHYQVTNLVPTRLREYSPEAENMKAFGNLASNALKIAAHFKKAEEASDIIENTIKSKREMNDLVLEAQGNTDLKNFTPSYLDKLNKIRTSTISQIKDPLSRAKVDNALSSHAMSIERKINDIYRKKVIEKGKQTSAEVDKQFLMDYAQADNPVDKSILTKQYVEAKKLLKDAGYISQKDFDNLKIKAPVMVIEQEILNNPKKALDDLTRSDSFPVIRKENPELLLKLKKKASSALTQRRKEVNEDMMSKFIDNQITYADVASAYQRGDLSESQYKKWEKRFNNDELGIQKSIRVNPNPSGLANVMKEFATNGDVDLDRAYDSGQLSFKDLAIVNNFKKALKVLPENNKNVIFSYIKQIDGATNSAESKANAYNSLIAIADKDEFDINKMREDINLVEKQRIHTKYPSSSRFKEIPDLLFEDGRPVTTLKFREPGKKEVDFYIPQKDLMVYFPNTSSVSDVVATLYDQARTEKEDLAHSKVVKNTGLKDYVGKLALSFAYSAADRAAEVWSSILKIHYNVAYGIPNMILPKKARMNAENIEERTKGLPAIFQIMSPNYWDKVAADGDKYVKSLTKGEEGVKKFGLEMSSGSGKFVPDIMATLITGNVATSLIEGLTAVKMPAILSNQFVMGSVTQSVYNNMVKNKEGKNALQKIETVAGDWASSYAIVHSLPTLSTPLKNFIARTLAFATIGTSHANYQSLVNRGKPLSYEENKMVAAEQVGMGMVFEMANLTVGITKDKTAKSILKSHIDKIEKALLNDNMDKAAEEIGNLKDNKELADILTPKETPQIEPKQPPEATKEPKPTTPEVGKKEVPLETKELNPKDFRTKEEWVKAKIKAYHGTGADFDKFNILGEVSPYKPEAVGVHFGTKEQAEYVAKARGGSAGRVKEVYLDIANPVRLEDRNSWSHAGINNQLYEKGIITKKEYEDNVYGDDYDIREVLRAKGYDSIVYANRVEGKGDSYIVFDNSQIKTKAQLEAEWEKAHKSVGQKPHEGETKLYSGIPIPIDKFYEHTIKPAIKNFGKSFMNIAKSVQTSFAPEGVSKEAYKTSLEMRTALGRKAREQEQFAKESEKRWNFWNKQSEKENISFMTLAEKGAKTGNKNIDSFIDTYRKLMDKAYDYSKSYFSDIAYIKDYFPHIWEDSEKAEVFLNKYIRRMGKESFSKERNVSLIEEGLKAGLKLKYKNVEDVVAARFASALSAKAKADMLNSLEKQGFITNPESLTEERKAYVDGLSDSQVDKELIKLGFDQETIDSIFKPTRRKIAKGEYTPKDIVLRKLENGNKYTIELTKKKKTELDSRFVGLSYIDTPKGRYYGDKDIIRLIDRKMQQSIFAKKGGLGDISRGFLGLKNSLVQFKLGLSAFHGIMTTISDMTNQFVLASKSLGRGDFGEALKRFAEVPISPIKGVKSGGRLRKAYLYGAETPEEAEFVDTITDVNGRVTMPTIYKIKAKKAFREALAKGDIIGAGFRALPRILEAMQKPILEEYVPRLKLAKFWDTYKDWTGAHPKATPEMKKEYAAKLWDSMDNRLGELVYDNLFWHRIMRDVGVVSTLSLGWNLGSAREAGGAVKDLSSIIMDIGKSSNSPHFTDRILFVASYPVVAGIVGGLTHAIMTGKLPKTLKDLYYPEDGNGNRITLPSYMKDVYSYKNAIEKEGLLRGLAMVAGHKASPLISLGIDLLRNRDFYNVMIRDPKSPLEQQFKDVGKFLLDFAEPISISSSKRMEGKLKKLTPFLGLSKAPAYISRTKIQNDIYNLLSKHYSPTKTRVEWERKQKERELVKEINNLSKPEAYDKIKEAMKEGILGDNQDTQRRRARRIFKNMGIDSDVIAFGYLNSEEQKDLWNKMDDQEKAKYYIRLHKKIRGGLLNEHILKIIREKK